MYVCISSYIIVITVCFQKIYKNKEVMRKKGSSHSYRQQMGETRISHPLPTSHTQCKNEHFFFFLMHLICLNISTKMLRHVPMWVTEQRTKSSA